MPTLTWVPNAADRKPDFDLSPIAAGDRVTLQLSQDVAFRRGLKSYTITVDAAGLAAGFEDFAASQLKRGVWYARAAIGTEPWSNVVTLNIR
jgi:hypothetical protein